jgi:predicted dehydrogenase
MRNKIMKIAVWSIGPHALKNILPSLKINKNIELYGVYTRDSILTKKCSEEYECIGFSSSSEMLNNKEIDIIYTCSPIGIHAQQGLEVLNANKHFWCEKPLTSSFKDTEKLIQLSVDKELSVAEGFMYLYHPQFLWLKEYLNNLENNDIKKIDCIFTLPYLETPGFRYDNNLGGGTLLDIGTYPISAILGLVNSEDPAIVLKKEMENKKFSVDMNGSASLVFPSGIQTNLFWGIGFGYKNEIDILMEKGSIYTDKIFSKNDSYIPEFQIRDQSGIITIIKNKKNNHFNSMFDHFISLVGNAKNSEIERNRIMRLAKLTDLISSYQAS